MGYSARDWVLRPLVQVFFGYLKKIPSEVGGSRRRALEEWLTGSRTMYARSVEQAENTNTAFKLTAYESLALR